MSAGDVDVAARDDVHQLKGTAVGLVGVLFLCVTGSAPLAVVLFNMPLRCRSAPGGAARRVLLRHDRADDLLGLLRGDVQEGARGRRHVHVRHTASDASSASCPASRCWSAYTIFGVSLIGGFAKFTQLKLDQYDIGVPWIYIALFASRCCVCLAYFDVEISAKVLGVALLGELAIILIMSFGILGQGGNDGLSVEPILPWNAFQGVAPGIGIFFAFWSWVGFEAAPNYAEESRDPVRIIPIAVYFSCIVVGHPVHDRRLGDPVGLRPRTRSRTS